MTRMVLGLVLLLWAIIKNVVFSRAFLVGPPLREGRFTHQHYYYRDGVVARSANNEENQFKKKGGYEFGDVSRFLVRRAKSRIQQVTGKDTYQVGDLTRWIDQQAKAKVANFTKAQAQGRNESSYQFGDISREIVRRVQAREYDTKDLFLALRLLLSMGASLTPIATVLPTKYLLDLINFGLAQDVSGRVMEVLATALDQRVKQAITGDPQYQIGDLTKQKLQQAIASYTGKESGTYEFGDITRKLLSMRTSTSPSRIEASPSSSLSATRSTAKLVINDDIVNELEDWDRRAAAEFLN